MFVEFAADLRCGFECFRGCGLLPMFVEFAADLRCEFECFRGCWKSGVVKGQRRSAAAVPGVRCVEKDGSGS